MLEESPAAVSDSSLEVESSTVHLAKHLLTSLGCIFQCSCHPPLQPCAVTNCLTNLSMGFVLVALAGAIRLLEKSLHVHLTLPLNPWLVKILFLGKPTRCGSCHLHFRAVSSWEIFWASERWVDHSPDCPVEEEHDGHWQAHREQQHGQILLLLKLWHKVIF